MTDGLTHQLELSVIIPAYNEEALLARALTSTVSSLEELGLTERSEIIVVDNNSTDRTAEIAKRFGVRLVFEPENQISRARNAGGFVATGRFLIFLDADTEMSAALLSEALMNLRSGRCCGGGVTLRMHGDVPDMMARVLDAWNGVSTKLGLAAGCFIFCLRDGFFAVNGFSEKVYAGEEIWFSRALKKWGKERELQFRVITDVSISTSNRKIGWFSTGQLVLQSSILILFPWATRSRRLCRIWYHRPEI